MTPCSALPWAPAGSIDSRLRPRPAAVLLSSALLSSTAAGLGLSLLSMLPAGAHGSAEHGVIHGALHPLLGLDHLLMLVAVGLCAAQAGRQVLGYALTAARAAVRA